MSKTKVQMNAKAQRVDAENIKCQRSKFECCNVKIQMSKENFAAKAAPTSEWSSPQDDLPLCHLNFELDLAFEL
jgi:hypothetical protein